MCMAAAHFAQRCTASSVSGEQAMCVAVQPSRILVLRQPHEACGYSSAGFTACRKIVDAQSRYNAQVQTDFANILQRMMRWKRSGRDTSFVREAVQGTSVSNHCPLLLPQADPEMKQKHMRHPAASERYIRDMMGSIDQPVDYQPAGSGAYLLAGQKPFASTAKVSEIWPRMSAALTYRCASNVRDCQSHDSDAPILAPARTST